MHDQWYHSSMSVWDCARKLTWLTPAQHGMMHKPCAKNQFRWICHRPHRLHWCSQPAGGERRTSHRRCLHRLYRTPAPGCKQKCSVTQIIEGLIIQNKNHSAKHKSILCNIPANSVQTQRCYFIKQANFWLEHSWICALYKFCNNNM